ncbi:hypothetical protein ACWEIM_30425, partial [Streptomyces sp. NPDC004778]
DLEGDRPEAGAEAVLFGPGDRGEPTAQDWAEGHGPAGAGRRSSAAKGFRGCSPDSCYRPGLPPSPECGK